MFTTLLLAGKLSSLTSKQERQMTRSSSKNFHPDTTLFPA